MKHFKNWKKKSSLVLTLAVALATAAPLQASEFETEKAAEEVSLPGEEILLEEPVPEAMTVSEETAPSAAEDSEAEPFVTQITTIDTAVAEAISGDAEVGSGVDPESNPEKNLKNPLWLHAINGVISKVESAVIDNEDTIKGIYDGDVLLELGEDRILPENLQSMLSVTRSNGTFDGWYTKAAGEELVTRGKDGEKYSVWSTVKPSEGCKVEFGKSVPEGVTVLYAVFTDKSEESESEDDRRITFYLDWNGIGGQFGHCLTCIREYKNGEESVKFTADDAAVYGLNFRQEFEEGFEKPEGGKWEFLKGIWNKDCEKNNFNGYKFLGWSKEPVDGKTIWEDTEIEDGMSFYAQWEKDGTSSEDFDRSDPEAGPLTGVRIEAADGTTFGAGTLSASVHGVPGASLALSLRCFPVRAEAKEITWSLKITDGLKDGGHLADVFKNKEKSVEITVSEAGASNTVDNEALAGLEVKAEGSKLTVKNTDGAARSIVVSAVAKGNDDISVSSPASATLSFFHTWMLEDETSPTCKQGGVIRYTCTECEAKQIKTTNALGHVYEKSLENRENKHYYEITSEPTCTEAGVKQYNCLRCGETNGSTVSIPATGHSWSEWATTKAPTIAETGVQTRTCALCGEQETKTLPQLVIGWQNKTPETEAPIESKPAETEIQTENEAIESEAQPSEPVESETPEAEIQPGAPAESETSGAEIQPGAPAESEMSGAEIQPSAPAESETPGAEVQPSAPAESETPGAEVQPSAPAEGEMPGAEVQPSAPAENKAPEVEARPSAPAESEMPGAEVQPGAPAENKTAEPETQKVQTSTPQKNNAAEPDAQLGQKGGNDATAIAVQTVYAVKATGTSTVVPKTDKSVKTGWQKIGGKKYYFNQDGTKKTGWQKIGKKKYYFGKNGVMKTGWQKIGKKKYYFGKNGVMRTGWQKISKKKYYFGKNGVMRTGKQRIGKKTYHFGKNGVLKQKVS